MAVSECGLLCKYVLIIFNILFGLLGIAMFGLGLWLRFSSSTGGLFNIDFNTRQFVIGVTVLISIGAVMVIISAVGDYGACSENKTALRVFYFTVGLLAIAVILAGILAYFYSDKVGDEMSAFYMTVYAKYVIKENPGLSVTLKIFHNALHCCGIGGSLEPFVRDTCPSTEGFLHALLIPACPMVIEHLFKTRAPVVLGLFIGTGVLMFITMACSRVLMKQIRTYETARIYFN
ncbi:CD9 antigen-like isoform X1 [Anguilla anguilla]|uniref:CD9 antigen-like isoform X1 n=1 Tax=Anguilla anguilla TaxID=7936 RepID=UPI0015AFCEB4|nr:CD9 antigen-like isoform X1 [Anguilla anguilla]